MSGRRSGRVWTELHSQELFRTINDSKRRFASLMASAPIHSPIYEEMAKANAALHRLLELVSVQGTGTHNERVAHYDPELGRQKRDRAG